jgi:hypothetical protein
MPPGPGSTAAATAAGTGNASGSSGGGSALPPLLGWLERAGIWWDERLVQIRVGQSGSSGPDLGVFAVADISENQVRGRVCVAAAPVSASPRVPQRHCAAGMRWRPAHMNVAAAGSAAAAGAQVLCMIPRAAILSRRNTSLASVLEAERLGGGLALTIAVMFEASLGPASFW